ncbi:hypothetical protein BH23ACT2_BH23ACT2_28620 [soil metagenome]
MVVVPNGFFGRDADRALLLDAQTHRGRLTVVGPGGVGKTRLVAEVVPELSKRVGADLIAGWFSDLPVGAGPDAVAGTLGFESAAAAVVAIAERAPLVFLDNCEHVGNAIRTLCDALFDISDAVLVVATSRAPLGIQGERLLDLDPLPLPVPAGADAQTSAAMALFLDRASAAGAVLVPSADPRHRRPAVPTPRRGAVGDRAGSGAHPLDQPLGPARADGPASRRAGARRPRQRLHRLGGSHAQRDVLQRTLVDAAIRVGDHDRAQVLVNERLTLRPLSVFGWTQQARLHAAREQHAQASTAANTAAGHSDRVRDRGPGLGPGHWRWQTVGAREQRGRPVSRRPPGKDVTMHRRMMKSKIHRATVTDADLHYVGSVTVDRDLMDAADLVEYEQVAIVDIDNGARLETYVIEGPRGGGDICLNGAAARLVSPGDRVILISYADYDAAELEAYAPTIVHVDSANGIVDEATATALAALHTPAPRPYVEVLAPAPTSG